MDEKKEYDLTMFAYTPGNQVCPGLHPKQGGQQVREVLLPLCSAPVRLHLHPALGPPTQKDVDLLEWAQGKATKMTRASGASLL